MLARSYTRVKTWAKRPTPLLFLELLGISLNKIDPILANQTFETEIINTFASAKKETASDTAQLLLEAYRNQLSADPRLQRNALRRDFARELTFRRDIGSGLMKSMYESNIRQDGWFDHLWAYAASDRVQVLDLKKYITDDALRYSFDHEFLAAFQLMVRNKRNFMPFGRILDQMFIRAVRSANENKSWSPSNPYRQFGEGVDTEIVHFAAYGSWRQGKKNPLVVFTNEKRESWRSRCGLYIGGLDLIYDMEKKSDRNVVVHPGYIFEVDRTTGSLSDDFIDVSSEYRDRLGHMLQI